MLLGRQMLVAEKDDAMIEQSLVQIGGRCVVEVFRQIDPFHNGPESAADRPHADRLICHLASLLIGADARRIRWRDQSACAVFRIQVHLRRPMPLSATLPAVPGRGYILTTGLADRPMISDLDIWRAANLLIRRHGEDAEIEAAKRADQMLDRGDLDGQCRLEADQAGHHWLAGPGEWPAILGNRASPEVTPATRLCASVSVSGKASTQPLHPLVPNAVRLRSPGRDPRSGRAATIPLGSADRRSTRRTGARTGTIT